MEKEKEKIEVKEGMSIKPVDEVLNTCSYVEMEKAKPVYLRVKVALSLKEEMECAAKSMALSLEKAVERFLLEGVQHRREEMISPRGKAGRALRSEKMEAAKK